MGNRTVSGPSFCGWMLSWGDRKREQLHEQIVARLRRKLRVKAHARAKAETWPCVLGWLEPDNVFMEKMSIWWRLLTNLLLFFGCKQVKRDEEKSAKSDGFDGVHLTVSTRITMYLADRDRAISLVRRGCTGRE